MTTHSIEALRCAARQIFMKAVEAADPAVAVRQALTQAPFPTPGPTGQCYVISIGKAAPAMMREALKHIEGPHRALCITHPENEEQVEGATLLQGAHPVPNDGSLVAGQAVKDLLAQAGADDRVIALISGGGSALMALPARDISIKDKGTVSALLLGAGIDITQMNLVRQQLSQLKGGGLLRVSAPAPVTAYILSDVIGDDLRAIASGPTVAPIGTRKDARAICEAAGVWPDLPPSVQMHLSQPGTPEDLPQTAQNTLIGSNRHSLHAAQAEAKSIGAVQIVSDMFTGDVKHAATVLLDAAEAAPSGTLSALLAGGETTVQLTGTGRGGRNQELALHVAMGAAERGLQGDWVFLSGGTDGRDGPTDAAGGIVDAGSLHRMAAVGADPAALLQNNDSYAALAASGDLLMTGATGTNVADIQCFLISKT
ncbi:glycerate kinase type-2 family protein [Aliiroseovarius sp. S253]|uniref:glycerate kinase type-2 family protein n=1 Tax=Aliiroseovarius sp. S253 TaxID=3415133 RepID=UPI003C7BD264